jgi:hypothetical protein
MINVCKYEKFWKYKIPRSILQAYAIADTTESGV